MKPDDYAQMLAKHGIRATANRIMIAEALDRAGRPMSMSELEEKIWEWQQKRYSQLLPQILK